MGTLELERLVLRLMGDATHMEKTLKHAEGTIQKFADAATGIGMAASAAITAPLVMGAKNAVKLANELQHSMAQIEGLANVPHSLIKTWTKDIRQMSTEFGKSADEMAHAMFFIASSGHKGKAAMDLLKSATKGSIIGMGEVKSVAFAVSSAVNAYKSTNLQAAQAVDILTAAIREGKVDAASLATVFGRLLPFASAMGVDFAEIAGTLSNLTKVGATAAESAVAIQAILSTLAKPSDKAEAALKKVGLSMQDMRNMIQKPGGLIEMLRVLDAALDREGDTGELSEVFRNIRALRGALAILAQNPADVDKVMKSVRDSAGSLDAAFGIVASTNAVKFQILMESVKGLLIEVGGVISDMITPALSLLGEGVRNATKGWEELSPGVKQVIIVIAGLAAAIGPLLVTIGYIGPALALAFSPALALLAPLLPLFIAVGAAVVAFIAYAGGVEEAWNLAKETVTQAWEVARTKVQEFLDWARPVFQAIASFAAMIWEDFQARTHRTVDMLKEVWTQIERGAKRAWEMIGGDQVDWDQVRDRIVDVIIAAEFALRNFGKVWNTTWLGMKLVAIKAFFELEHQAKFFKELGDWLTTTFATIWTNVVNMGMKAFRKLFENFNLGKLTQLIKGDLTVQDLFKDLEVGEFVAGLVKGITNAPELKDRIPNKIEEMWEKEFKESAANLTMTFLEFRAKKLKEFNEGSFSINPFGGVGDQAAKAGAAAGKTFKENFKREGKALDAILFGSSKALEEISKYRSGAGLPSLFGRPRGKMAPIDRSGAKQEQKVGDAKAHTILEKIHETLKGMGGLDILPLGL